VRSLSPDESELWARVAATIRPLSRERKSSPERGGGPAANRTVEGPHSPARPAILQTPDGRSARASLKPRALADRTLDGSWDKKLRSGSIDPDRVLDLHGLTLDAAWSAIDRGLDQGIARGDRVLLLITGHHRPGEPPVQRGKIRAAVHDWLAASRHSRSIAAVRGAHRRHGGGGSLYIILKR
jgi:DNA-nicking Smr family endonuclease